MPFSFQDTHFPNGRYYEQEEFANVVSCGVRNNITSGGDISISGNVATLSPIRGINNGYFFELGKSGEVDKKNIPAGKSYVFIRTTIKANNPDAGKMLSEWLILNRDYSNDNTSDRVWFKIYELENGKVVKDFRNPYQTVNADGNIVFDGYTKAETDSLINSKTQALNKNLVNYVSSSGIQVTTGKLFYGSEFWGKGTSNIEDVFFTYNGSLVPAFTFNLPKAMAQQGITSLPNKGDGYGLKMSLGGIYWGNRHIVSHVLEITIYNNGIQCEASRVKELTGSVDGVNLKSHVLTINCTLKKPTPSI